MRSILQVKRIILTVVFFLVVGTIVFAGGNAESGRAPGAAAQVYDDFPVRNIELFVHTDPGTGTDRAARALVEAINQNDLLPVSVQVLNRPGGGGNIVRAHILEQNDPHVIVSAQPTAITNPLRTGDSEQQIGSFTPIAVTMVDHNVIVARSDAPWDDLSQLLAAANEEPIIIVGGAMGGGSSINHALLRRTSNAQFLEYLPLGNSAQAPAVVLGGHAHAMSANPPEIVDLVEAGEMKVLGVLARERLDIFPDVPTARELGFDAVNMSFRGLMGPPSMTEEQARYIAEVVREATATQAWRDYVTSVGADAMFLDYDETKEFFEESAALYAEILEEMGLLR